MCFFMALKIEYIKKIMLDCVSTLKIAPSQTWRKKYQNCFNKRQVS